MLAARTPRAARRASCSIRSRSPSGEQFRVVAENTVGDTFDYSNPGTNEIPSFPGDTGFPHVTVTSVSDVLMTGQELVPAAPTGLTAALDPGSTQVTLQWADNATNETGYVVERSDNGGAFAVLDATLPADSVGYVDTTVVAGNLYEYRVAATNAVGTSDYSNTAQVDMTAAAPTAPSGLNASVVSATQVDLAWADNATTETGYVVERSVDGGAFAVIATLAADAASYSDLTVTAGHSYAYQVAATNGVGQSDHSNQATASITVPPAPTNLSGTNITTTSFTLNWQWAFAQPDGFEVQVATNSTYTAIVQTFPDVNADQTSLVISGLSKNTRYYVRIHALNAVGTGAWATLQVKTAK